jgi:hypothetical protein
MAKLEEIFGTSSEVERQENFINPYQNNIHQRH